MLFANAVFNVFTGVFDVTNCVLPVLNYVRQNSAVVFLNLTSDSSLRIMFSPSPILFCINALCCSILCYANYDSIIHVSNYVLLNPGLQEA